MKRIDKERMKKELADLIIAKRKAKAELRHTESTLKRFTAQCEEFRIAWEKEVKRRGISESQLMRSGYRYKGYTYTMYSNLYLSCKYIEYEIVYMKDFLKGVNSQITWRENRLDELGTK